MAKKSVKKAPLKTFEENALEGLSNLLQQLKDGKWGRGDRFDVEAFIEDTNIELDLVYG